MKRQVIMIALCVAIAALAAHARVEADSLVYIGTRAASASAQQGIYAARLDARTGKLVLLGQQIELFRNSWLVTHPSRPVIYLANNPGGSTTVETSIHSYAVDAATGKLQQINQVTSGASDTTYLVIDAKSNTLFGAAFGSGEVTALPLLSDGSLGAVVSGQKHTGSGPHPRQTSPHAHAVAVAPGGRYVLSSDMGADRIFVHRFDPATRALTPAATPFEASPPGTGPRHLVFHPGGNFLYTNTELTADVRAYRWDAKQGRLQFIESVSAYPAGYTGHERSSAEIGVSRDGRFLYVTLRGDQDSIVVYEVNNRTGALKEIQRIASQGKSPRSFGIDPTGRWMLITHDVSGSLNLFGIDKKTGKLSATGESLSIPGAATVAFYPD